LSSGIPRGERPATFREVFAVGEFRAIYAASTLSWVGDYVARAAITALAFQITGDVLISAAAFAISYAPWLLGGSVLVALAERYPYRSVMIICDLARMALMIALVAAIPDLPLPALLGLLLASALLAPPFDAARSATLPSVLPGDKYVVGVAVHSSTAQPAQVAGYLLGAALAAYDPRVALLLNAGTFAISAALVRWGVKPRKPALAADRRTHLLAETVDGFRLVFGTSALRAIALLVFGGALFVIVPEGLAAAWAAETAVGSDMGWVQGMIMASVPAGWILGGLSVTRLMAPNTRQRFIRPFAVCAPLALVPAIFSPPAGVVALLAGLCGFAMGGLVPVANAMFVRALPDEYRARAFGVMQGGLALLQGGAVLVTGALAQVYELPLVVGAWSIGGVVLMSVLIAVWPPARRFEEATAAAKAANGVGHVPRHAAASPNHTGLDGGTSGPHVAQHAAPTNHTGPNHAPAPAPRSPSGVSPTAHAPAVILPPGTMER
jgi:MFS family permease